MTACQGGRLACGNGQVQECGFIELIFLFDKEFLSVGLAFKDDLMTGVGEAIEDRIGHNRVGEESGPVGHGAVRGEDDAF